MLMCVWWGSTEAGKPTVALIGRMARKLGARSWIGCRDEGADRLLCLPLRGVCAGNWRTAVTGFGLEVDASARVRMEPLVADCLSLWGVCAGDWRTFGG